MARRLGHLGQACAGVVSAALLLTAGIEQAHATFPGANGLIVFESRPGGTSQLVTLTPSGAFQHPVAAAEAGLPAWSPDGSRIAFARRSPAGNGEIFTMASDGTDVVQLTNLGWTAGFPAWSPDGSRLALAAYTDAHNYEIVVVDANGANPKVLTGHPSEDVWPAWSPDGTKIAFQSSRTGDREIFVMDADGSDVRNVTNRPGSEDDAPDWSPDGAKIVYWGGRTDIGLNVYTVGSDGTDVRQLTSGWLNAYPRWSPDGRQIVFVSARDLGQEIYVMDADGTDPRRLTRNGHDDLFPAWQPVRPDRMTTTDVTSPLASLIYGDSTTFTARVRTTGAVATGRVQFAINGEDDGPPTALDGAGDAHHEPDYLLNVGDSVTATYGGNRLWGWSAGAAALRVVPATTTTTLSAEPNPAREGDEVDALVTVANRDTDIPPYGSVQFAIDGAPIGPPVELDDDGQVAVSLIADVPAGQYVVTADYADDTGEPANFTPSSASLTQTITSDPIASAPPPSPPAAPAPSPQLAPRPRVTTRDLAAFTARVLARLRARGLTALRTPGPRFPAQEPGTLEQQIHARVNGRRVLVASGRHRFGTAGSSALAWRLTANGRRLARRARAARIEVRTTFAPVGGARIAVTRRASGVRGRAKTTIAFSSAGRGEDGQQALLPALLDEHSSDPAAFLEPGSPGTARRR